MKIIDAQRAKLCNNYKNTKLKLLKTNAAIWFNKLCRTLARLSIDSLMMVCTDRNM